MPESPPPGRPLGLGTINSSAASHACPISWLPLRGVMSTGVWADPRAHKNGSGLGMMSRTQQRTDEAAAMPALQSPVGERGLKGLWRRC